MARRRRITRKEIKQPDEFLTFWQKTYFAFRHNPRQFLAPILAAVLVGGVVIGTGQWWRSYRRNLKISFAAAVRELDATSEPDRLETLRAEFQSLGNKAVFSNLSALSLYYQAVCLHRSGKFGEAEGLYQRFLKRHRRPGGLYFAATLANARCIEAGGRTDEARQLLEKELTNPANTLKSEYLYITARMAESSGDYSGALDLLEELVDDYPESPQAKKARSKIEELKGIIGE